MEEISLRELIQIFWEKKIQMILIMLAFVIIGVIYSFGFVTPEYKSSTKLLLTTNAFTAQIEKETEPVTTLDVMFNVEMAPTYSELAKSNKIIRKVISNLNLEVDEEKLKNSINVVAVSDTEIIKITVKNENPTIAASVANEIAKELIENV